MSRIEKLFSIGTIVFIVLCICYFFWKKNVIQKSNVYVIGRVYEMFDTENGYLYRFKYHYKGVDYREAFKGSLTLKDSLFVLKISKKNPQLWNIVKASVSSCLKDQNSYYKTWETLPVCKE